MTVLLLAASALLAASGSRLAAAGFVAAAAVGATGEGPTAATATWTAALGAGFVMLGASPRRAALPAVGAAATLVAASATNGATVLLAWVLASGAAFASWPNAAEGRRRAVLLLGADLAVAGAVIVTALGGDIADWTAGLGPVGKSLLGFAALARIPAVVGPPDAPEAAGLVVRAQIAVLGALALGSAPESLTLAVVGVAAAVFAFGGTSPDGATRDGVQEAGLVVLALASSELGWSSQGWVWGALAGGTLTRYLRLSLRGSEPVNAQVRAVLDGGGMALPFLPTVAALCAGAAGDRGAAGLAVVLGLASGLAARARLPSRAAARGGRGAAVPRLGMLRAFALGLAAVAALWGPSVTSPRPPAGLPAPWPPTWAAILVLVAGVAGALFLPGLAPSREPPRAGSGVARLPSLRLDVDVPTPAPVVLLVAQAALAAGLWGLGWIRGFL